MRASCHGRLFLKTRKTHELREWYDWVSGDVIRINLWIYLITQEFSAFKYIGHER